MGVDFSQINGTYISQLYLFCFMNTVIWHANICSLTFKWIFLYYSLLPFHDAAFHSRYESHFGSEAAQLCMIGCIAVLSHSHRHSFDLSPASKVLSKHCKEYLSKCSLLAHYGRRESSYSAKGSSKYLFLIRREIRMRCK